MNTSLQERINRLNDAAANLARLLKSRDADLEELREQRETLVQEQWRLRKKLAAAEPVTEDFERLRDENQSLRALHNELRNALAGLLGSIKALGGELRHGR